MYFLRALPCFRVLAIDKNAAPNNIPDNTAPPEKIRILFITSTSVSAAGSK